MRSVLVGLHAEWAELSQLFEPLPPAYEGADRRVHAGSLRVKAQKKKKKEIAIFLYFHFFSVHLLISVVRVRQL